MTNAQTFRCLMSFLSNTKLLFHRSNETTRVALATAILSHFVSATVKRVLI